MAITYNLLLREVAVTTNALVGARPVALQTAYATVPLTSASFQSSIFPFGFLKDAILNAQQALFMALASTATNPLRGFIESQTAALGYGDQILTNAGGLPVVGAFGTVRDAEDNEPCTANELEIIRMKHLAAWMTLPVYERAFLGNRVFHTRTNVIVDVCGYERPDSDSLDLTANILLPDVLGPAITQGVIGECFRDDEYIEQAQVARTNFNQWVQALQQGMARIEQQTNPTPDAQKGYRAA